MAPSGPVGEHVGPARAYAGIGAHETPPGVRALMREAASVLARRGWSLRSGMSPGADRAFYEGALASGGEIELYLPRAGFGAHARDPGRERRARVFALACPSPRAYELAARAREGFQALSPQTRALLARDVHQVLGAGLEDPAALVVCWTPEGDLDGRGARAGGTGQALRIARAHGVKVLNLARAEHAEALRELLGL